MNSSGRPASSRQSWRLLGFAILAAILPSYGASPSSSSAGDPAAFRSAEPWSPTVRVVGQSGTPCPHAKYTTITDAVNGASGGDEIDICPALYAEQLVITKPLTLHGLEIDGIKRVLVQPTPLTAVDGLRFVAVITVMNTSGVTILAVC